MASSRHYDSAVTIRADRINGCPGDGGCIRPAQRGQFGNDRAGAHPTTTGKPLRPRGLPQWGISNNPANTAALSDSEISIVTNGIETVEQESGTDHPPAGGAGEKTPGARP